MDMGVAVVVPMRMPVGMGMVVMMGRGRGGNHSRTLYYNITPVHARLRACRSHAMAAATNGTTEPQPGWLA